MTRRHIALIRGINVGRAKRVAMADLRALVEGLGYRDVRTLLNSGNVVKIASAIVSTGTSANTVVKVRLPATCGRRSSFRRRPAKRNRSRTWDQDKPRKIESFITNLRHSGDIHSGRP